MTAAARHAAAFGWLAALALLALFAARTLEIGTDLRLFLPAPDDEAERLLVEEIGDGPAARLLLVAIEGGDAARRAEASRALAAALRDDSAFRHVANGEFDAAQVDESLLPYRYLLTPAFDARPLDATRLGAELEARLEDLASPIGPAIEPWLARDPTLALAGLVERMRGNVEVALDDDVFVSRDGERALLAIETDAAGFDPDAQAVALAKLDAAFARVAGDPALRLVVSGPGRFAATIKQRTQRDAARLSVLATLGMALLTFVAYRSGGAIVLAALPLASAAAAGLAAVAAAFGEVHGITLAFGATLIGVAQDYPIHLLSHQRPAIAPRDNARSLWPTLATGVVGTCVAYGAFLVSGVAGLAQLGLFTIAGLAAAALATRFVLPPLIDRGMRDRADVAGLARIDGALDRMRVRRVASVAMLLALAAAAAIFAAPAPAWQNDLAALTPLPRELLERDAKLRADLGAPDARHLIVLGGADADAALARAEAFEPALAALVESGAIAGYDHAARYLPSVATQRRRQAALPGEADLRAMLPAAIGELPFDAETFEPFVADIARARALPPLTPERLAGSPLETRVGGLLLRREDRATAIVSLAGLADRAAVERAALAHGATFLDLKGASEALVARYRQRILASLAIAAAILAAIVLLALRSPRRALRVLLPMLLATLAVVAVLRLAGIPMSLFHLIALVLGAGLGLDYALFFEHAGDEPAARRRTLHGLLVCAASTLMVFALLATSSLPVLRAIGTTVSLAAVLNFALSLAFAREGGGHAGS